MADVVRALKGARLAGYFVNKAVINHAGDIELRFGPADDNNPDTSTEPVDAKDIVL
jgi:hypothetical protein